MPTDLYIHALTEDFTEEHYKAINQGTVCSKYFQYQSDNVTYEEAFEILKLAPAVWAGQVRIGDYQISEVFKIEDIIGENFPTVDGDLMDKIKAVFEANAPNDSEMSSRLALPQSVLGFLGEQWGNKVFTARW